MSEASTVALTDADKPVAMPVTAGGLLRQARQAQGLHIAALAAAIKVTPRKLDALENDRFDELLDATFTRALAQTVCRTLKVDPAPVLALMPQAAGHRLEHLGEGINAPFRERPGQAVADDWGWLGSPAVWGPALIVLAALLVFFLPRDLFQPGAPSATKPLPAPAAASSGGVSSAAPSTDPVVAPVTAVAIETVHSAPALSAIESASAPSAGPAEPAVAGVLQFRANAESWVEVLDGRGQPLMSRSLQPGEVVGLDGALPMRVIVGNASATDVTFRGRPLDLTARTRDNVARLELN
jgi:cytoskeleton protein RodZ